MCTNRTHLEMCPVVSFLTNTRLTSHKKPYLYCCVLYALYPTDLDFYSVMTNHCRRQWTQLGISLLRETKVVVEIEKEILGFTDERYATDIQIRCIDWNMVLAVHKSHRGQGPGYAKFNDPIINQSQRSCVRDSMRYNRTEQLVSLYSITDFFLHCTM